MPITPKQNFLLAALSAAELKRLRRHLEPVDMPLPTTCIVSLLYVLENGASAEIAVVGNEGVVGISLFMGGETTPSRAVVQSAGSAYRMPGQMMKDEFNRGSGMQHLMLRYTQALRPPSTSECRPRRSTFAVGADTLANLSGQPEQPPHP